MVPASGKKSLTAADRARIRHLIANAGERATCLQLEVSRETLSRALAGLDLRRATAAWIRARLTSPHDAKAPGQGGSRKEIADHERVPQP